MANAGGAWTTQKRIGATSGGKGSECPKAPSVGDTVGDPFKDTRSLSQHLIKLVSTVSIVFSLWVIKFNQISCCRQRDRNGSASGKAACGFFVSGAVVFRGEETAMASSSRRRRRRPELGGT
jgi:hypothetical protein